MNTIGIRDFKARASAIIRTLESSGEEVVITRHGKPCGKLVAIGNEQRRQKSLKALRGAFSNLPDAEYEDFLDIKGVWKTESFSAHDD